MTWVEEWSFVHAEILDYFRGIGKLPCLTNLYP